MQFIWSSKSALFIVLILIAGLCFGQSKGNQNEPNKNQKSSADRSDTTVVITQQAPPAPQQQAAQADLKHPFDFWEWARTSSPTDILGLILTGLLVGITTRTLFFLRKQVVEAEKSANAATAAVVAANKSADVADQSLYVGQRARVVVESVVLKNFSESPPTFIITIANHGGGKPAEVIECQVTCSKPPLKLPPNYGTTAPIPLHIPLVKGALSYEIQADFKKVHCNFDWGTDTPDDLYIYGVVFYRDGFHQEIRETGFCFFHDTSIFPKFRIAAVQGYNYMK